MADANLIPNEERDGHLRIVWNTLMFFASESSYTMGERTGGVLAGCPRNPPPTPYEMAGYARRSLESMLRYLGREPDDWMRTGDLAPGYQVIGWRNMDSPSDGPWHVMWGMERPITGSWVPLFEGADQ